MTEEFLENKTSKVYSQNSDTEPVKSCPEAISDNYINIDNRERSIVRANYGRGNGESRCGGCAFFDISNRMKKCMDTDTNNTGYCWSQEFVCSKDNVCDMYEKGGPITSNEESYEQDGSYSEFEENKQAVEQIQTQKQLPTLEESQQVPQQAMPPSQPTAPEQQVMSEQAMIPEQQMQPSYKYGGSLRKFQDGKTDIDLKREELYEQGFTPEDVDKMLNSGASTGEPIDIYDDKLDDNTDIFDAEQEAGSTLLKNQRKTQRKLLKEYNKSTVKDENFAMYNADPSSGIIGKIGNWFKSVNKDFTDEWDNDNQKANYQQHKITNPHDDTRFFDPNNPDVLKSYETVNMEAYNNFANNRASLYPNLYSPSQMDINGKITYGDTGKLLGDMVETEYMPNAVSIVHSEDNLNITGAYIFDGIDDNKEKKYKFVPFNKENPTEITNGPNSQEVLNANYEITEAKAKCENSGGEWIDGACVTETNSQKDLNKEEINTSLDDVNFKQTGGSLPSFQNQGQLPKAQWYNPKNSYATIKGIGTYLNDTFAKFSNKFNGTRMGVNGPEIYNGYAWQPTYTSLTSRQINNFKKSSNTEANKALQLITNANIKKQTVQNNIFSNNLNFQNLNDGKINFDEKKLRTDFLIKNFDKSIINRNQLRKIDEILKRNTAHYNNQIDLIHNNTAATDEVYNTLIDQYNYGKNIDQIFLDNHKAKSFFDKMKYSNYDLTKKDLYFNDNPINLKDFSFQGTDLSKHPLLRDWNLNAEESLMLIQNPWLKNKNWWDPNVKFKTGGDLPKAQSSFEGENYSNYLNNYYNLSGENGYPFGTPLSLSTPTVPDEPPTTYGEHEWTDKQLQQWLEWQNHIVATGTSKYDPYQLDLTNKNTWPSIVQTAADGQSAFGAHNIGGEDWKWLKDDTDENRSKMYNLHRTAVNQYPEYAAMPNSYFWRDKDNNAYPYLNESGSEKNKRVPTQKLQDFESDIFDHINRILSNPGKQNSDYTWNDEKNEYVQDPDYIKNIVAGDMAREANWKINSSDFLNNGDLENYINNTFPEGSAEREYLDANPNTFSGIIDHWNTYRVHHNMANQSPHIQKNSLYKREFQGPGSYITKDIINPANNEAYNELALTTEGTPEYEEKQRKLAVESNKKWWRKQHKESNPNATEEEIETAYKKFANSQNDASVGTITQTKEYNIPPNMEFLYNSAPGLVGNPNAKMAIHNNTHGFGTKEGVDLGNPYLNMIGNVFASPKNTLQAASIPLILKGASSIPLGFGLTSGNLINAGFAGNAVLNTFPNAYKDYQNEDYGSMATNLGFGALELSGVNRMGLNIVPKNYSELRKFNPTFPALNTKGQNAINNNLNVFQANKMFSQIPLTTQVKELNRFVNPNFTNKTLNPNYAPLLVKRTGGSLFKAQMSNGANSVAANYMVNPEQFDYDKNMPKEGAISSYGKVWQGGQWVDATTEDHGFNTPNSEQFGNVDNAFSGEAMDLGFGKFSVNGKPAIEQAANFNANDYNAGKKINKAMIQDAANTYGVDKKNINLDTYNPQMGAVNKQYGDVWKGTSEGFVDNQFTPEYNTQDNFKFKGAGNTLSSGQYRDVVKQNEKQAEAEELGYASYDEMKAAKKQQRKDKRDKWGDTFGQKANNIGNYLLDSDLSQMYQKGSKAVVEGAGIVNDIYDSVNANKEQERLLTTRTADSMYGVTSADALSRGEYDENTGIFQTADKVIARQDGYGQFGTELPRRQYNLMAGLRRPIMKNGGEAKTVTIDLDVYYELLAAGAEIELI